MLALASSLVAPQLGFAWGADGHRMINRLAIEKLPPDTPEFLRSKAAIEEIEYLGPEPDRWRGPNEPELSSAGAPEHFILLELADMVGTLPRRRYDFIATLYAAGLTHPDKASELRPEKVGMQPWAVNEVYQRLQAALREYTAERLAAGASVLRDMIETAWQQSAKPEPERHEGAAVARSTAPRACPCR